MYIMVVVDYSIVLGYKEMQLGVLISHLIQVLFYSRAFDIEFQ